MALSEKEQELLAQLEAALSAEDPRLAHTLRSAGSAPLNRRRATFAGLVFLLGVAVLIGGIQVHWVVSVLGFVLMLAATSSAIGAWAPRTAVARPQPARRPGPTRLQPPDDEG